MIRFLLNGLVRDKSRSLFPFLVVFFGVMLTVVLYSWIRGWENGFVETSAHFETGHVKIATRAYLKEADQFPNDLATLGIDTLISSLEFHYPELIWLPRIRFGGLLDLPDQQGETRSQGPCSGLAVRLDPQSPEISLLNLGAALARGRLPEKRGEILLSDDFAASLGVQIGDTATLIGSSMYGSMATGNLIISGTVRFGITVLDRGAMVADMRDIQNILDMENASSEIVGFFRNGIYDDRKARALAADFNSRNPGGDEFSPVMTPLRDQSDLTSMLALLEQMTFSIIGVFILIMSLVLWNAGLRNSLRRYGEIGVRLAIGENKGSLYLFMLAESLVIGLAGSLLGTAAGLAFAYLLQEKGINLQFAMQNATMLTTNVMRARITPASTFIGFIPGLFSTLLGTAISGIGIYKRETSQLFKELEV